MKITEATTYFKLLKYHAIIDPISRDIRRAYMWPANRITLWEITAGSSKLHRRVQAQGIDA